MAKNKNDDTPQLKILRELVIAAGGPLKFAEQYSRDPENMINQTYVSQLLNGSRQFGEKSRRNMARRAGLPDDYFEQKLYVGITPTRPLRALEKTTLDQLSDDEITLVSGYRNAHPDVQQSMLSQARSALKTPKTGTNDPLPHD